MTYLILVSAPIAAGMPAPEEVVARAIWQLPGVGLRPEAQSVVYRAPGAGDEPERLLAAVLADGPEPARARAALSRVAAAGNGAGGAAAVMLVEERAVVPDAFLAPLAEVAPDWPLARGTAAACLAALAPARRATPAGADPGDDTHRDVAE